MGKIIDITNQKFGFLTPLNPNRINGRFGWHCKCDCGNEVDVESNNLRSGKTQSCGCLRIEKAKLRKKDLVGQRFGKLIVIEETNQRSCGAIVWKCKCDCGKEIFVSSGNLKSGHTKSCGCLERKHKDLIGQRFGKLVVLEYISGTKDKRAKLKCQCDCGNITYVPTNCLARKDYTQSCGCLKSKGEQKISKLLRENNINFETQKSFDTCRFPKTNTLAYFDFFVDNKYLIEFDGIQHYEIFGWCDKSQLELNKYRDKFKNIWCKENNIPLIRIPYSQLKDLQIKDLLLEESNFIWQDEEIQQENKQ